MARTFPVWAAILLIGAAVLFVIGHVNVYIPKDQKRRAKELGTGMSADDLDNFIFYKTRFSGLWYLVFPGFTVIAPSIITFFVTDYHDFAMFISPIEAVGYTIAVIIAAFGYAVAGLLCTVIMFVGEETMVRNEQAFYSRRYGVFLISEEENEQRIAEKSTPKQ